jgi:hypothetical protein
MLDAGSGGLKIRVSVVQFHPWPPLKSETYFARGCVHRGDVSVWFPLLWLPLLHTSELIPGALNRCRTRHWSSQVLVEGVTKTKLSTEGNRNVRKAEYWKGSPSLQVH